MTRNRRLAPDLPIRLSQILLAPIALFAIGSVNAQSVDAPASVCINDSFDVEWTGPNADGDLITVAEAGFAADQSLNSRPTSDGNPAGLRAPAEEGIFEIRYVQGELDSILVRRGLIVSNCLSSGQSSASDSGSQPGGAGGQSGTAPGTSGGGGATQELPIGSDQAVLAWGVQTNYGDVVNRQGPFGNFDGTIDALCDNAGTLGWALGAMVQGMEQAAYDAGLPISFDLFESTFPDAPSRADIADGLGTVMEDVCDREEKPPEVQPFVVLYAYCRMTMVTPGQVLDIHLPPTVGDGTMMAADYTKGEAIQMSLRRGFDDAASVVGSGWSSQVNMTSAGGGGSRIGYPTTQYAFDYEGGLGGGGMVPFAEMVSTKTSGTVWASEDVPGLDIIRSFYENLTTEVSPDQGGASFFAGLLNNLVGLLRNGLPLEIDQTIESKVMGRTQISGRSHSVITGIELTDIGSDFCSRSLIPTDIEVQDIDQQMSDAMSQSGVSQQEVNDAMQQYNEAMQNMTPQQRQAMEQYGLGNMMEQMMGGAAPGAAPGAAQRAAPSGSRSPGGSSPAGSNMPPSEELQGGSLTESVQKHLQALGYDVGAVDGEASLDTTIAISTFQAEKGMAVTGEVTPQLLGVLSAEVDSRR